MAANETKNILLTLIVCSLTVLSSFTQGESNLLKIEICQVAGYDRVGDEWAEIKNIDMPRGYAYIHWNTNTHDLLLPGDTEEVMHFNFEKEGSTSDGKKYVMYRHDNGVARLKLTLANPGGNIEIVTVYYTPDYKLNFWACD